LGKDEDDANLADNDEKDDGIEESEEITDDDQ
jgi:hypothetical protein